MAISWKNTVAPLNVPVWPNQWRPEWLAHLALQHQLIVALDSKLTDRVLAQVNKANTEQGGLLLGRLWRGESHPSDAARLVEICLEVPAVSADSSALSLKMDAVVWESARLLCDQALLQGQPISQSQGTSPLRVVGWYHSHPNLSAFFSQTDRQTQANFFANSFSVGWVIDPFNTRRDGSLDEAFFVGPQSEAIRVFRQP